MAGEGPLDPGDPRFTGARRPAAPSSHRELVESQGPGASPHSPHVRVLRVAIPALALAGVLAVVAVFWVGLRGGDDARIALGEEAEVMAAVAERPQRVCLDPDDGPCAWLSLVEDELLAFAGAGPVTPRGGGGIRWCETSGYFASIATGGRYDRLGQVVDGPATRGLDRYELSRGGADGVVLNFARRQPGPPAEATEPLPREGPDCDTLPHDPDADL